MKLLISLALVTLAAAALTRKSNSESEKTTPEQKLRRKIADTSTLLRNIEVYDGTSKGQKPIGGDDR